MPVVEPSLVAALRADLDAAGYTVTGVEELLGPVAAAAMHREQALPALLRATGGDPLAVLTRVLLLGGSARRAEVDAALPHLGCSGAGRLGLLRASGEAADDTVRAVVDLRPYQAHDAAGPVHWWVASDLGEAVTGAQLSADHVLGVGGASTTLAQVTLRQARGRALDLGTGCGIQAMHAARHCAAVVATDVSRRALDFAAFTTAVNDVRGVELRRGSMLDPVAGDTFDLVVSNPPFVITPRDAGGALPDYTYRDGGRSGDDLVRDLVLGVGRVLAPGGVAQLLGNWEHRAGQDWTERVGGWLDDSGLDGWVVQREVLDVAEYVETWLRDGGAAPERDRDGWQAAYRAWLHDFASRRVEAVGLGLVTLRRPVSGRVTLRRTEALTGPVRQPLGGHLAAALAAHDWLTATDDAALLGSRLAIAGDVTEERYARPGASDPEVILLRQGDGFARSHPVGTATAGVVGACDGELALGRIVAAVAELTGTAVAGITAEVLPRVRELVRDAMLVPVTGG